MNKKMISCKTCGQEIAKSAKSCPHCGAKNKKSIFKKWWFWTIVVVVLCVAISNSGTDVNNTGTPGSTAKTEVPTSTESINTNTEATHATETEATTAKIEDLTKTEYHVGDILEDGDTRIVFMASGDYIEENEFLQPAEGNKYIYLQFAFENISKRSDISISAFSFECFADGYAAEMYYGGDEALSATLSPGRKTTGFVYFEIPVSTEVVEVEYEPNILIGEKIKFVFEG
ncbi:MAG: DUF4352 domain-containing protein, partial [Oscillospiraceae bacterium]|nr:DUF4352 domain-containing protein [Oscillospiraceae bacterium]